MNFSTLEFWEALLPGLLLTAVVLLVWRAEKSHRWMLSLLSLTLLGLESMTSLVIFGAVFSVTYFGLRVDSPSKGLIGRLHLIAMVLLQFLPLAFYKYAAWGADVLGAETSYWSDIVIPVGISFYTFQMVGLLIDTKRNGLPLPSFLDTLNFCSFFPQIVAGPIERRSDLLPQISKFRFRFDVVRLEEGVRWIVLGLFLKLVIAENVAAESSAFAVNAENPFHVWAEALFFTFRIYNDFAGYSLIALGLGKCLGIELMLNFLSPYWTTNFRDFWRSWHRSLSNWFRDYLYIPLGGNQTKWKPLLVVFVFAVSGLWHGAGWNFLVWGMLHGVLLLLPSWEKLRVPVLAAWVLHFALIVVTWLPFYETNTSLLMQKAGTLFDPFAYTIANAKDLLELFPSKSAIVVSAGVLGLAGGVMILEGLSLRRGQPYSYLLSRPVTVVLIAMIFLLPASQYNEFIYFNF